jgi:hypothetical protein
MDAPSHSSRFASHTLARHMKQESSNHSIQRTRASRSVRAVLTAQWRLAPTADAGR